LDYRGRSHRFRRGWYRAAIGGIAAAKAARSSAAAARDARDAVALTIKPEVRLLLNQWAVDRPEASATGPLAARAVVLGPGPWGTGGVWPARDVVLQFSLTSGRQGSRSLPVLEPARGLNATRPPYLEVVIGEPSEEWPPPEGDHVDVFVLFSDSRGLASYRVSMSADLVQVQPGSVSIRATAEARTTRISD
jgi:hypothetical protein